MEQEKGANFTQIEIERLFKGFSNLRVLVVGDVMIDAYYWGKVTRISPEAPVPVVQVTQREHRLGGAANVALNVRSLGAEAIVCAIIGDDEKGKLFENLLEQRGFSTEGVVRIGNRPSTVKTRIISGGQHLLRVDEESTRMLNAEEEKTFLDRCLPMVDKAKADVVIFEDYNKGLLSPSIIRAVSAKAKEVGIPVTVDPKKEHFFEYRGVDLFKPNFKELVEGLRIDLEKGDREGLVNAISQLEDAIGNRMTLVTLSELGIVVKDGTKQHFVAAHPREILDVSGAGDSVISVASLALAMQARPEVIAALSNLAGGLVCEKVGVVPIDRALLLREALKLAHS